MIDVINWKRTVKHDQKEMWDPGLDPGTEIGQQQYRKKTNKIQ